MILNDVADGASMVVERAATLHAEIFGHGDLHTSDEGPIPEGLQERIREPEEHHIVHRPLAQIVVDAEDMILFKPGQKYFVQLVRRSEIVPEWLFDNNTSAVGASGLCELF